MKPLVGISLMPEPEFLKAALPLFQQEAVDVVEWSFDTIRFEKYKPIWLRALLQEYSTNQRLIGHGVRYSLFDGKWTKRQAAWLNHLKKEVQRYNYTHITEHFGFMSSDNFHKGAPLPVSLHANTLAIGIDRLQRIQDVAHVPVGVENLAFAFTKNDVARQGNFLRRLIKPINGFIILDLHNIYCQAMNFGMDMGDIIALYPLNAVREIHVSGGSWQKSIYAPTAKRVRRDTHDGNIPKAIFEILPTVLEQCPHVEFVIFERLGNTIVSATDRRSYRNDFWQLQRIIQSSTAIVVPKRWGKNMTVSTPPVHDMLLYKEQQQLCKTLMKATHYKEVQDNLQLQNWDIATWQPSMIETAISLIKKWG